MIKKILLTTISVFILSHLSFAQPQGGSIKGKVNDETGEVSGIKIPGMLSWLVHGDAEAPVIGLNDYKPEDRPPVNIVFQAYHIMVAIGMLLIALTVFATVLLFTGKLYTTRWYLKLLVWAVLLPQFANQIGWIAAEVGRQPWIVWELLRTSEGLSKVVTENQIIFSLILFSLIYILLFILFLFLLDRKIKHGPEGLDEIESGYDKQKAVFSGTEK